MVPVQAQVQAFEGGHRPGIASQAVSGNTRPARKYPKFSSGADGCRFSPTGVTARRL